MTNIFNNILDKWKKDNAIVIVSGLPRSGTSMMMRMIEAGGIKVVTDDIRKADVDNPRGYYEFERVKQIQEDSSWLKDCRNKVFKMVSELLYHLPADEKYKVVFMRRNMDEILASQKKMLDRLEQKGADVGDDKMAELYKKHLKKMESWLENQDNIEVLYINYNDVIQNPHENAMIVNNFLGEKLDVDMMTKVVEKSLYRQRK